QGGRDGSRQADAQQPRLRRAGIRAAEQAPVRGGPQPGRAIHHTYPRERDGGRIIGSRQDAGGLPRLDHRSCERRRLSDLQLHLAAHPNQDPRQGQGNGHQELPELDADGRPEHGRPAELRSTPPPETASPPPPGGGTMGRRALDRIRVGASPAPTPVAPVPPRPTPPRDQHRGPEDDGRATAPPPDTKRASPRSVSRRLGRGPSRLADGGFRALAAGFALSVLAITATIGIILWRDSSQARATFGWPVLWTSIWDPVAGHFGALPFIYRALVSALIALVIAVLMGVGAAICLSELLPMRIADPATFLIELLVAVPSVVYGLVGVFVLVPIVRSLGTMVASVLGWIPLFAGPVYGIGLL